jgi:hypothetical protein
MPYAASSSAATLPITRRTKPPPDTIKRAHTTTAGEPKVAGKFLFKSGGQISLQVEANHGRRTF